MGEEEVWTKMFMSAGLKNVGSPSLFSSFRHNGYQITTKHETINCGIMSSNAKCQAKRRLNCHPQSGTKKETSISFCRATYSLLQIANIMRAILSKNNVPVSAW